MPLHLLHLYHCWAAQPTGNWEEERSTARTDSDQESCNLKTPGVKQIKIKKFKLFAHQSNLTVSSCPFNLPYNLLF